MNETTDTTEGMTALFAALAQNGTGNQNLYEMLLALGRRLAVAEERIAALESKVVTP